LIKKLMSASARSEADRTYVAPPTMTSAPSTATQAK
jgi:hypothetical protein